MAPKTTTCNKCGSLTVRWARSNRTGKYYLQNVVVWYGESGRSQVYGRGPHFLTCTPSEAQG